MDSQIQASYHPHLPLENPQHFINLCPPKMRDAILQIPHDWFLWEEHRLLREAYGSAGEIPDKDYELRISFWEEYNKQFQTCRQMRISKIVSGICSENFFYAYYCNRLARILFILQEPSVSKKRLMYGHHLAMAEVLKIIKMPIEKDVKTGLPDAKLLSVKAKLFEYLDQRVYGSVVQKIEQTSRNLNVNVEATPEQVGIPTAEDIDRQIIELEKELPQQLPPPREVILPIEAVIVEAGRVHAGFKDE